MLECTCVTKYSRVVLLLAICAALPLASCSSDGFRGNTQSVSGVGGPDRLSPPLSSPETPRKISSKLRPGQRQAERADLPTDVSPSTGSVCVPASSASCHAKHDPLLSREAARSEVCSPAGSYISLDDVTRHRFTTPSTPATDEPAGIRSCLQKIWLGTMDGQCLERAHHGHWGTI